MSRRRRRRTCGRNLLLAVNKPYGEVTRAVDNLVGRALGDDGVGHIGTLDPAVTGVLVLAVGQARKLIPCIEEGRRKAYRARISFGVQTDTDDAQGTPIREAQVPERVADQAYAKDVLATLVGPGKQRPPRFSAIKVDGVRAYDRARAGEEFELPERDIVVYEASLLGVGPLDNPYWDCDFVVSPGTYIRAIARDLGTMAGSAAHLGSLCRTASGLVTLEDCVDPQRIVDLGIEGVGAIALDPAKVLGFPIVELGSKELESVCNGRPFLASDLDSAEEGALFSLVRDGMLYGVWRLEAGILRPHVNCTLGVEGVRA